ncbi:MAG: hypothetical protein EA400_12660 [Chromatiaceae bacterium]|nr:MAG: hypothetical protein EA400_12660 [Chromatiaceae bacterium]
MLNLADEAGKTVVESHFQYSALLLDAREPRLRELRASPRLIHLASERFAEEVRALTRLADMAWRAFDNETNAADAAPTLWLLAAWVHAGRPRALRTLASPVAACRSGTAVRRRC